MENTTLGALLDEIVSIREKMKGLDWFDGEDPFQIILETIGTQQCRLVQAAIWSYDLKLLADEATGGDMLSVVESDLEDWIKSENATWAKEADTAKKAGRDWHEREISRLRDSSANRRASVATRSLWAWYGRSFPKRIKPGFVTTKQWTRLHKEWLLETRAEDILRKLQRDECGISFPQRKLTGIRDFILAESKGDLDNLSRADAIERLRHLRSVAIETAPKIALFYFRLPFVIFDSYLLRVCQRHGWLSGDCGKWNVASMKRINTDVFNALAGLCDAEKTQRLKAFHAIVNDCGSLYCDPKRPKCENCDLRRFLPPKMKLLPNLMTTCHPLPERPDASPLPQLPPPLPRVEASSQSSRAPTPGTQVEIIDAILGAYPYREGRWLSAERQVELLRRAYDAKTADGRNAFPAMHGGAERGDARRSWDHQDRTNRMREHVRRGQACKAPGQNLYMLADNVTPAAIGVSQKVVHALAAYNVIPRYDVSATSHISPKV